jgi:glucokinase
MANTATAKDSLVLAIDAGGTYFKSILVRMQGEVLTESFFQAPSCSNGSRENIIAAYQQVIRRGLQYAANNGCSICGIGISTPGPFDYKQGMSLMQHKFQAIKNIPLRNEIFSLKLLPENLPIVFQQDVHSFLIGEQWTGVVKGTANVAAITLGTGLGFALMKDSKILDNGRGGPHTVIFNRPFEAGILEDRISRRGIIEQYCKYAACQGENIDVHDIALKARNEQDVAARQVFMELGTILAEELSEIFNSLAITEVVFGGQISKSFDLFAPAFKSTLHEKGIIINVVPTKNIEFSALVGTAKAVTNLIHKKDNPS